MARRRSKHRNTKNAIMIQPKISKHKHQKKDGRQRRRFVWVNSYGTIRHRERRLGYIVKKTDRRKHVSTTRFNYIKNGQLGTCTCLHIILCHIMSTTLVRPGLIKLTKHGSHAYSSLYAFPSTPIQASLFFACFTNLYKQRNIRAFYFR